VGLAWLAAQSAIAVVLARTELLPALRSEPGELAS
jgi:hypothetical protein